MLGTDGAFYPPPRFILDHVFNTSHGRFVLVARIAMGGMGEVLLALDPSDDGLDRFVALKCLHTHLEDEPRIVDMFYREARICSLFRHKNLIRVEDASRIGDRHTMVMEFAAGVTLREILERVAERNETVTTTHIASILYQICRGLNHAHSLKKADGSPLGIIHRDLSPDNIIVGFDGLVRVIDFGVAAAASRTGQDGLVGKIAYMSPEQCRGEVLDGRSDLYALGTIFWELLQGRSPYPRTDRIASLRAITEDNLQPPASTPQRAGAEALNAIWRQLHAKHREDRFRDPRAASDAFAAVLTAVSDESDETLSGWVQRLFPHEAAELQTVCEKILRAPTPNANTLDLDNVQLPAASAGSSPRPRPSSHDKTLVTAGENGEGSDTDAIELSPTEFTTVRQVMRWRRQRRWLLLAAGLLAASVAALILWLSILRGSASTDVTNVSVVVAATPTAARVFVNGEEAAYPPIVHAALGEDVEIRVDAPGYLTDTRTIAVSTDLADSGLTIGLRPDYDSPVAPIGEIRVNYLPIDAVLSMNGAESAIVSPATIRAIALNTPHSLRLERAGYETLFIDLKLQSDEPLEFDLEMNEGVPLARLSLTTVPAGATAFVDGEPVGLTPLVHVELPAHTTYTVELQLAGYRTWRRGVVLRQDDVDVRAALERDIAKPAVQRPPIAGTRPLPSGLGAVPAAPPGNATTPSAGAPTRSEQSPYRMLD